ncbi:SRPBCC family protein [Streptomyces bacillaris]|uniref:SRPBCC family protein n=1 Tax=Streptomyces bacillaris TaxID=68179 RepID=UPI003460924B
MSQVEESIEVEVPISAAYNQWTQFESFPQFMEGVERIEQRTQTLTHRKTKIAGVEREFDAEITEQIPDERVAWTSVGGEAKQAGVVTFHYIDDNTTKVMLQLDYDPESLAETVGDKLGFVKRQATDDLKRFKQFIESRGAETGGWHGTV